MKIVVINYDKNTFRLYSKSGMSVNISLDKINNIGEFIESLKPDYIEIVFDDTFILYKKSNEKIYIEIY